MVRRIVTTRAGGASAAPYDSFNLADHVGDEATHVRSNRARLARSVGLTPEHLVWLQMVHGKTVASVDSGAPQGIEATDAAVTDRPGVALVVHVADCVPVLLTDAVAGVIGVAHAGRAGAALGVVPATVEAMVERGATPANVEVLLGPAICGACYELPAEMARAVEKSLPGSITRTRTGSSGIDLRAGLRRQLDELGVGAVATDPACTYEDQRFYSYRRDGVTGRFAGLVVMAPDGAR